MSKLREEHKAKVQGFLTAEQKAKMEASKKDRKGKFGSKKSDRKDKGEFSRKGKGGMDRMNADLKLTDEQTAKLKSSREKVSTEMKALRADKTLSEDARKEKVKELKKKQKEDFKSVLTEEQLKKFEERKKHSPKKQSV
jgi:Spy/CpxP family protein refolding chaperone